MASSETTGQQLRGNSGRIKWTEGMNNFLLDCKNKAKMLAESENPPRLENGRKKGYMRLMKELWDDSGYGELELTSQNLRDQAARLEKTMGDVRVAIFESVGQRAREEEPTNRDFNARNLESTNYEVNHEDADLHTVTVEAIPTRPAGVLNQQTCDLIDSSNVIFARVNTQPGEFGERDIDTRIKERPTKGDLNNINLAIIKLMEQHQVSPRENPFSYLWIVNCVLYSVVMAFLLNKGWKKQRSGTSGGARKQHKWKREYEKRVLEVRKKISIAEAELMRLKENRKITKKGKRNRAFLEQECKGLSAVKLVSYMEKQKSILRKLKRGFSRSKKQEEARVLNQQFQTDASRVYANMREIVNKDKENDRPRYIADDQANHGEREMFNNIEEASEFWRTLWETEGTGDRNATWLEEIRSAIHSRVPEPADEDWDLDEMDAAKVLTKKKNWSAPGPDRLANFWWKRANSLHKGVATAFQVISRSDEEYPQWFSEGKTSLIPKPGIFSSDNQRPITCLNTIYKWYTSCLLVPTDKHLNHYELMEGAQRGARAGCSGTVDNLLIDRIVTLDCHRRKRNLSMGWVDVKKAYDSIDHGWLEEMMLMHRFPTWLCRAIQNLSRSWSTRIVTTTRKGREVSDIIRFRKGLPQGDALCPRLFTVCLNPIAWKIRATEGYRLSKPIDTKVTDLLYIDDLKIFAASESRLNCVMKSVRPAMEDVGLQWNPKKCAVVHFKRGTHVADSAGLKVDGNAKIPSLEDGQQYKFLGVLESLKQEEKLALQSAAKEYLRRLSVIWTSPLSDYHRVVASNQFAMPAMSYYMWTQHWPITDLKQIDREARKIVVENGGKHPCGSTSLLYLSRDKGGRGMRSIETEYKETKIKAAANLYQNRDPAMKIVRDFEERAESMEHQALTKEAAAYAKEYGLELQLEYPDPVCVTEEGEVIPGKKVKNILKRHRESRAREEVKEQRWQGKLVTERERDEELSAERCFWWLSDWRTCPTHTIAGMFELYEQLLPTRLYTIHKTRVSDSGNSTCRLCGTAPEGMAHILSACPALAQTKYLARHDAVLKVLFFEIIFDLGLIDSVPPWYSPIKPQSVYETAEVQAYWDVPVYGEYQELRANRVDARIVNNRDKQVIALEMSCPWVSNRGKKTSEKTMKYAPLRWELKQRYPGYEINQCNIILDVLGGWSKDLDDTLQKLVGSKAKGVLKKMQKACLSGTLNIARTFKVII